jgi:hypothetical protein
LNFKTEISFSVLQQPKCAGSLLTTPEKRSTKAQRWRSYKLHRSGTASQGQHFFTIEELISLDIALTEFKELYPRAGSVVELRFFCGMTESETAAIVDISVSTLKREWEFARVWLYRRLNGSRGASQRAELAYPTLSSRFPEGEQIIVAATLPLPHIVRQAMVPKLGPLPARRLELSCLSRTGTAG